MESQNIKQWIRDYLDFAILMIAICLAPLLLYWSILFLFMSDYEFMTFIKIEFAEGNLKRNYSDVITAFLPTILVCLLIVRLFTKKLNKCFIPCMLVYGFYSFLIMTGTRFASDAVLELLIFHIVFSLMILSTIPILFYNIQIFLAKYPIIKKFLYSLALLMVIFPATYFSTIAYINHKKENMMAIVTKEIPIQESREDYMAKIKQIDDKIATTKKLTAPKDYSDFTEVINREKQNSLKKLQTEKEKLLKEISKKETRAQQRDAYDKRIARHNELLIPYNNMRDTVAKIPFVEMMAVITLLLVIIILTATIYFAMNTTKEKFVDMLKTIMPH